MTPRITQVLVLTLSLLHTCVLLACDRDSVAVQYLAAIENMDWALMTTMLAEDARYTDPTMEHYDRPAIELDGREDIVAFWRSSSEDSGTSNIHYTTTACFETAGYHVVNLDISITVAGHFWGVDKDEITIPGKVVSVLKVIDGSVAEHHDYVSYAHADKVVADLQAQFGKVAN